MVALRLRNSPLSPRLFFGPYHRSSSGCIRAQGAIWRSSARVTRGERISMRSAFILIALLSSASAVQAAPCVLGNSLGYREFSLPRNSVCLIKRHGILGMKLVSMKITIRPKLGQFGSASISELAYRAGNVAGDDYFEYISTQSFNGGTPRDYRTRNVVHVTP
jgi:hypothetical protein